MKLAEGSLQREGVMIHIARFKLNSGRFDEARADLNSVTNAELADLKTRVLHNLELREHPPVETTTNSPPIVSTNAPASVSGRATPGSEK